MLLLLIGFLYSTALADLASEQLPRFKNETYGPVGIVTTSNGAKVDITYSATLNSPLLFNNFFMESMTHFLRERIPERVVHAKGYGAFGYFQVTHDVTDICKAKFLNKVGKKTPVAVRFSLANRQQGASDTALDPRGFAIKFYTEDGNFDILAFNTPMFSIKDPVLFPFLTRSLKRNPATNFLDYNMLWDFALSRPETIFFFMYLFAGSGTPAGYRHMPGFSIHTYQIYNEEGESYFARFSILPDQGVKNLNMKEIPQITAKDLDYFGKDLYDAIEKGEYPTWTVCLQVLTFDDVINAEFDVFDVTKVLPLKKYPLRPIGKLVLNRNPKNHFAEVEQLAYEPNNLVPGILGSPDKLFEARRLAYRSTQLYRLGANFNKIQVNCPFSNGFTYNRDGVPPTRSNEEDIPNYYPNSFNGPILEVEDNRPKLISIKQDYSYNFDQAADLYNNELEEEQKNILIKNILRTLNQTADLIQEKAIQIFSKINTNFARRVAAGLA